jgi:hypothetical protein
LAVWLSLENVGVMRLGEFIKASEASTTAIITTKALFEELILKTKK